MKIGFLGNTNNYPFLLAWEIRNKCEILFFVDAAKEYALNRPEAYYGNLVSYPYPHGYIENTRINNPTINTYLPKIFLRDVIEKLNHCDAVIVNGYGHYILPYLRKSLISVSVFSGADLDVTCNFEMNRKLIRKEKNLLVRLKRMAGLYYSKYILKKSIFRTDLVSFFPTGIYPVADRILSEAKNNQPYDRFEHMHISTVGIDYIKPPDNPVIKIFNASRFVWKTPLPPYMTEVDNKKNDLIVKGLAEFINRTSIPLDINFVEKGVHVEATKELISSLGIEKYVTWHADMPHSEFLKMLAGSDIITDNMNEHVIGGGAFGMIMGRPLIGNAIPETVKRITGVESEICHSQNEEDVYNWLLKLVPDKNFREAKGKASRDYIMKYHNLADEANYFFDFIQKKLNIDKKHN